MKKITKEYREKTISELEKKTQLLRAELAKLALNRLVNPPKDTNKLAKKKKELAVILTVLTEKIELEKIKKNK